MFDPLSHVTKNNQSDAHLVGAVIGGCITLGGFLVKIAGQWMWKKFSRTFHKVDQLDTKVKIMDADLENTKNILHEMRGEIRSDIKRMDEKCSRRHEK